MSDTTANAHNRKYVPEWRQKLDSENSKAVSILGMKKDGSFTLCTVDNVPPKQVVVMLREAAKNLESTYLDS